MARILIVDDDPIQLRLTADAVSQAGFRPVTASGGAEALSILRGEKAVAAVVLDLVMPECDGMAVLETMRRETIDVPVIVSTTNPSFETVATALRQGAVDYVVTPVSVERVMVSLSNALNLATLNAAIRAERHRREGSITMLDLIARAPAMARVVSLAAKASRLPMPILIEGEPGTGKDLLARIVHTGSDRAGKPLISFDCAGHPPNRIEAALFGFKRGAFPGAMADQPGSLAQAHGGTLVLAEVGELPPDIQQKLVGVLETGEFTPLGANRAERINVRIVSTSTRRLLNLAKTGELREDLYYRLNVFPIYVPPLRDRAEDIPELVAHFIARFSAEASKRVLAISPAALGLLERYDWPGNVGELENAVYRAVVLAETAYLEIADFPQIVTRTSGREAALMSLDGVTPTVLPVHIDATPPTRRDPAPAVAGPDRFVSAEGEVQALSEIERALIAFALEHHQGRMSRVARALGIGRSTLYRKVSEYGLTGALDSDAA